MLEESFNILRWKVQKDMIIINNNSFLSLCEFYLVSSFVLHFTTETNIFIEVQMVSGDYDNEKQLKLRASRKK